MIEEDNKIKFIFQWQGHRKENGMIKKKARKDADVFMVDDNDFEWTEENMNRYKKRRGTDEVYIKTQDKIKWRLYEQMAIDKKNERICDALAIMIMSDIQDNIKTGENNNG